MMVTGILLAAGQSSRFGTDKLCYPLPEGVPVAIAAVQRLQAGVERVIAVIPPNNLPLRQHLKKAGISFIICSEASQGMGHSLAAGVRVSPAASSWIVALADMPFIQAATIQAVAAALQNGARLAAPFYRNKRGHPVGFAAEWRADLLALRGDHGARQLLRLHEQALTAVVCNDAAVLWDIDTPSDIFSYRGGGANGAK